MLKKIHFIILVLFHFTCLINAQSKDDKQKIIKLTNIDKLSELKKSFNEEYLERQKRIDVYLKSNPISRRFIVDGVEKEIYDVDSEGNISYMETTNLGSSVTIGANNVYNGGILGLNVQGQGMTVGVWDSGPARETHVEFTNARVNIFDFIDYSDHATHVMGTVLANGTNSNARGIAFQANGKSYDWTNDYTEMANEASTGLLVSNHSYWIGSNLGTWILGAYDIRAKQMDQLTYAAPYYLPVVSAGNDRNSNANTIIANHNSNKFGYDLIRGMNNAKNSLTVGAVANVVNYTSPSSVQMSSFSSWGPTDDGRIKPEVVAKGVSVFSSVSTSDNSYDTYQGTSMASPAVAGACLLLQQHYNNLNSNFMRSSTLKGLIMHSAKEAGYYVGPDYEYGWGLVDVKEAASIINDKSLNKAIIDELLLNNSSTYTRSFSISNPSNIKVSICWTDPASNSVNSSTVDPDVTYLVNDLDLKLTKNGVDYYPWSLDKNSFFNQATNITTNDVDIFERVDIDNAVGTYTLTVSHKGNLSSGSQNYSLIISGLDQMSLNSESYLNKQFLVYPIPAKELLYISSDSEPIDAYSIIDCQGRVVLENKILDINKND
ncbi:S8 family serine peptidase, partial [Flavobacterium sp. 9AF]|uniref:S8 family serine peptidase n=1 Tax=Flavobacterium sp. 9AF TaxID=2653142 RepID=UPI00135B6438